MRWWFNELSPGRALANTTDRASIRRVEFPGPRGIIAADERGKGQITQREKRRFVRMAGHHRGRGPAVGHARRKLPHTVAPRGVAENVNAVQVTPRNAT